MPALRAVLKDLGASRIQIRQIIPKDWAGNVRSKFPVQKIGRFVLLPSWRKRPPLTKNQQLIRLRQGQAFGTGLHASTRLMLGAIEKAAPKGKNVLDVGAGSGVLSFAALALGATRALCVEIEDAACAEMRENRESNQVAPSRMPIRCGAFPPIAKGAGRFDLVLGNLVTPVLCECMKALRQHLAKDGVLLMSGIHTAAEAAKVKAAAKKAGLRVSRIIGKGEWKCIEAYYS